MLLTIYFNETTSGALHTIQRGAMEVVSPLQDLASGAIKPFRDLVDWVGDSFDAKSENDELKKDLQDARIQAARLQLAAAENEKLRALLKFNESDALPGRPQAGHRARDRGLADRVVRPRDDRQGQQLGHQGQPAGDRRRRAGRARSRPSRRTPPRSRC